MADNAASEHSLLATFVLPVAQALRMQGIDALEVIEGAGIDPATVINPDRRISASQMRALMDRSVECTGDEAFGLLAAEQLQPQVLHGLGLAWLASDTLLDGLNRTVRFARVMSTGLRLRLEEDGELVHLYLEQAPDANQGGASAVDFGVGIITRMCRLTLGEFIAPTHIDMARPTPEEPARFESALASRIQFDCDYTRISWSRADIVERLATGDPLLAKVNDEQTEAYLANFLARSLSLEVVGKIVERLPDGPPNQAQIADDLMVSNRTLQRKLKEEGTSFMDLLQDTRLQLARKYLGQRHRSVIETAYLLGFSEPSTFSRAFKRWTGQAPAQYREQEEQLSEHN